LILDFCFAKMRVSQDVAVVRARFRRLVFELRVMGEGGFPPVVFPQPLTPQVILYEGATLNVAIVTDLFRFGVFDPLKRDLGFSRRIHPCHHARSGRGLR